ncbi:MAG: NYN domain-containing protein [Chloroflexi bacterium]|nr:NYN domain-containing protein [Chloroflexota bacterium]
MTSAKRVIVFVDGNNLYHLLKGAGYKTWVDIGSMCSRICGSERELKRIYYYNAPPPGGRSFTEKQNEYYAQVQKTPNLIFQRGWLRPTMKTDDDGKSYLSYVEKALTPH